MFKCMAGFIILYMSFVCHQHGLSQSADIGLFIGVFSVAAGADTLFFDKK